MGIKGVYSKPLCKHCGETRAKKFYGKMKTTCYSCHGKAIEKERKARRIKAIEHKGGKCELCGYNKFSGALEFHHLNPKKKDPSGLRAYSLKRLLLEVDKCMLLCANCHREKHEELRWQ